MLKTAIIILLMQLLVSLLVFCLILELQISFLSFLPDAGNGLAVCSKRRREKRNKNEILDIALEEQLVEQSQILFGTNENASCTSQTIPLFYPISQSVWKLLFQSHLVTFSWERYFEAFPLKKWYFENSDWNEIIWVGFQTALAFSFFKSKYPFFTETLGEIKEGLLYFPKFSIHLFTSFIFLSGNYMGLQNSKSRHIFFFRRYVIGQVSGAF